MGRTLADFDSLYFRPAPRAQLTFLMINLMGILINSGPAGGIAIVVHRGVAGFNGSFQHQPKSLIQPRKFGSIKLSRQTQRVDFCLPKGFIRINISRPAYELLA